MEAMEINLRWTFEMTDAVEREDGSNTYDFMLTDDLGMPAIPPDGAATRPNTLDWIMLDVSNN